MTPTTGGKEIRKVWESKVSRNRTEGKGNNNFINKSFESVFLDLDRNDSF